MRTITYRVQRFDGQSSYVQEYNFPYEASKTILWGLTKVKETLDPTLTFVAACRVGDCGACAIRVNNQAVLACETSLDEMIDRFGPILSIAPLKNFVVIRDLVVNWEEKLERLKAVKPWMIPRDKFASHTGCRQTPEDFKKIVLQASCILCGSCASECNKLSVDDSDFYEPYVYTKAYKFVADSRDKGELERLQASLANGLWSCVHCQECVTTCPKGIEPVEDISKMRQISIRAGQQDNTGARHARAFYKDLTDTGRLNEVKMAVRTDGMLKSAAKLPFALRLMRRGKLNPFHHSVPVKGIEHIREIIKAVKEAEKQ
ncbi:MAG: succinate dehydrogenase/fumarate reductase iron-sulfur subunit [Peptococcaceae bacterium]